MLTHPYSIGGSRLSHAGILDGEKEHETQAQETRSSTPRDALLQAGRTLMTCPYRVFGNHKYGSIPLAFDQIPGS